MTQEPLLMESIALRYYGYAFRKFKNLGIYNTSANTRRKNAESRGYIKAYTEPPRLDIFTEKRTHEQIHLEGQPG